MSNKKGRKKRFLMKESNLEGNIIQQLMGFRLVKAVLNAIEKGRLAPFPFVLELNWINL